MSSLSPSLLGVSLIFSDGIQNILLHTLFFNSCPLYLSMFNSRHLIFPVLFFAILLVGGLLILRTVEKDISEPSGPVYLETTSIETTKKLTSSNRKRAHQTYTRFASSLAEKQLLSSEGLRNIEFDLKLGDVLYQEKSWQASNRAFERVVEALSPLLDGGLGQEKALELEQMYASETRLLNNEIYYAESAYLDLLYVANQGYNKLQQEDWVSAIQLFSQALDQLAAVKQSLQYRADTLLLGAEQELAQGNASSAISLFQSVLELFPGHPDALDGLGRASRYHRSIEFQEKTLVPEALMLTEQIPPSLEFESNTQSADSRIAKADWHFYRRELRESLSLYLDVQREYPDNKELNAKISQLRSKIETNEISIHMDKAKIHFELGDWRESIATYRHILNVNPVNTEAREGWENAYVRFVAENQLQEYRQLIDHLIGLGFFVEAQETLNEVRQLFSKVLLIEKEFAVQDQYLRQQKLPVSIVLQSDGQTWVSIPGSMAPERFVKKQLTVLPGQLAFVAWRKGYAHKSILKTFDASNAPTEVTLICDQPIEWVKYSSERGPAKVKAALRAFDMLGEIFDMPKLTRIVRVDGFPIDNPEQETQWDIFLFAQIYNDLSERAKNRASNLAVDSRSNFIKAPSGASKRETVEYGQYLMRLEEEG